jgi:hypothetical protein
MPEEIPHVENPPTPAPQPAAPPATNLVIHGDKSEREIELEGLLSDRDEKLSAAERGKLEAERKAAEFERENQELKKIPAPAPQPKVKRKPHWSDPVISNEDENE